MLQARLLGDKLYVGVHTDEEILHNKGPVVMKLDERVAAVTACRWVTQAVPGAPYVTSPDVMDQYGCKYVVHGDDITSDANGEDCYKVVKDLGRFVVVKRTPNILTTDLVGRMLLKSKNHHFKPIVSVENHPLFEGDNLTKYSRYASDETGRKPGPGVYCYLTDGTVRELVKPSSTTEKSYKSAVYIDGGFDLFHSGHITALKMVKEQAEKENAAVIVGIHDDRATNEIKGLNYPIMNLYERSLCVLQCRYVDGIILGAPYSPTEQFLSKLPAKINAVYHGPTPLEEDPYSEIEPRGLLRTIPSHKYDHMNAEYIVNRVLSNKKAYEDRQKKKGWKAEIEATILAKESYAK